MRNLLLVIATLVISSNTSAEVLTAYDTPKGAVLAIRKDAKVWVKCFRCDVLKKRVMLSLEERGYTVVSKAADATTRVVIAAGISVPSDGKAKRLYAEDVYGKGFVPISPAIKRGDWSEISAPVVKRSLLDIDAGAVYQGVKLTGSKTGGILVGIGEAFLTRLIHQSGADDVRTPGVVELSVIIDSGVEKSGFGVVAASNTPETPDALLDAAIDTAIIGLVNGVDGGEASKNTLVSSDAN